MGFFNDLFRPITEGVIVRKYYIEERIEVYYVPPPICGKKERHIPAEWRVIIQDPQSRRTRSINVSQHAWEALNVDDHFQVA